MQYPNLDFKKNFKFTQGDIILLKDGYHQIVLSSPVLPTDMITILRIPSGSESKPNGVKTLHRIELIAQLLAIKPTELLEILYA